MPPGALCFAMPLRESEKVVKPHELGVDWLACAGHKCGAPRGTGFLFARTKMPVPALFLVVVSRKIVVLVPKMSLGLAALAAAVRAGLQIGKRNKTGKQL